MASSSNYWNKGWSSDQSSQSTWNDSTTWSSSKWNKWQGGQAKWQGGEESPATKWVRKNDGSKWQSSWQGTAHDTESRSSWQDTAHDTKDRGGDDQSLQAEDEFDEAKAAQSKRLRPPKRVREYQKAMTRRLIEQVLEEKVNVKPGGEMEVEHGDQAGPEMMTPPRSRTRPVVTPPQSLPKPPPMPPSWGQKLSADKMLHEDKSAVKAPQPKRRPAEVSTAQSSVGNAEGSMEAAASTTSPGVNPMTVGGCLAWLTEQSKVIRDELEAGAYVGSDPAFMARMHDGWKDLKNRLGTASRACELVVEEIGMWIEDTKPIEEAEDNKLTDGVKDDQRKDQ